VGRTSVKYGDKSHLLQQVCCRITPEFHDLGDGSRQSLQSSRAPALPTHGGLKRLGGRMAMWVAVESPPARIRFGKYLPTYEDLSVFDEHCDFSTTETLARGEARPRLE
jgi:hypothetical protein